MKLPDGDAVTGCIRLKSILPNVKIITPFYGAITKPSSHYTMGGVAINENAQVLDKDGKAIEGLYAAGEVVGGLYGAGRVAGNNTLDDIVFGKIAAKNAIGK